MPREPHKLLGLIPASVERAVVMGFEYQLFDFGFFFSYNWCHEGLGMEVANEVLWLNCEKLW